MSEGHPPPPPPRWPTREHMPTDWHKRMPRCETCRCTLVPALDGMGGHKDGLCRNCRARASKLNA